LRRPRRRPGRGRPGGGGAQRERHHARHPGRRHPEPPMIVVCRSPEETQALGTRLGRRLREGAVVACTGELGAGKTCFLQGLARGLGVTADVTSPTFVLVNLYQGRLTVYHIDAYRTESLSELVEGGIEALIDG